LPRLQGEGQVSDEELILVMLAHTPRVSAAVTSDFQERSCHRTITAARAFRDASSLTGRLMSGTPLNRRIGAYPAAPAWLSLKQMLCLI
jgi:hypothetical protein